MATGRMSRVWASVTVVLVVIVVAGAFFAWSRYRPVAAVEVSLVELPPVTGLVSIGGAVAAPGIYPYRSTDTIADLLGAAGGATSNATLELRVPPAGTAPPQRVDINRADVWLLEALPEIGPTLAERIVDYRQKNGPFRNTAEIMKVAGIGDSIFERIKDKITVAGE